MPEAVNEAILPLVWKRNSKVTPVDERYRPRDGDVVFFAVFQPDAEQGRAELIARGWAPVI